MMRSFDAVVSIKMLLNGNAFYKLLQKNLKALKLADVKIVDWSVRQGRDSGEGAR